MIILIMGPQGSGKSTQAQILAEKLNLRFISMGQVLRNMAERREPLGLQSEKYANQGKLVPNDMLHQVVDRYFQINQKDLSKGFIMDGFPRHIDQYRWINDVFPEPVSAVVHIDLKQDTIMKRIEARRKTEHREDESPEAVAKRLQEYHKYTEPLLNQFRQDGIPVIDIDGQGTIEEIQDEIVDKLNPLLPTQIQ